MQSAFETLREAAASAKDINLSDLLTDASRCELMTASHTNLLLDYSRQLLTTETLSSLLTVCDASNLRDKIGDMYSGKPINATEKRSVLHVALRAPRDASIAVNGADVMPEVHGVLDSIRTFSARVRFGAWVGATGKPLTSTSVIAIGIGGSYLGPEFVYESLRADGKAKENSKGRTLRFLANVDRATEGLDPESTLVVVISKTFTTAETMLNARTMRSWITKVLVQTQ